jgi:hypothetical protein
MSQEPKCLILDDDEIEKQGNFRIWREEKQKLEAARIFGGPALSADNGANHFPSAFRNPKKKLYSEAASAAPAVAAPVPIQKRRVSPVFEGKGSLIETVKTMLGDSGSNTIVDTWRAIPEKIATEGIPLLKLPEVEETHPYAPCTPPFSPRTPPLYTDLSGN